MGLFNKKNQISEKYQKGLSKSKKSFGEKIRELFARFRRYAN